MKQLGKILLVLLLSVIHIHFSVNIQDNALNPLTLYLMLNSRSEPIGEYEAFVLGGILIQSFVTIFLARYFIQWKKYKIWIMDLIICIIIGFIIDNTMSESVQPLCELNSFYKKNYNTGIPGLGRYIVLFTIVQSIFLSFYSLFSSLSRLVQRK